jgi:hypothetical protein
MTIGAGIFLIAVGAILKFATNAHVQGLSIDTIGLILMIAGAVGLILGLFQELIWSDRARARRGAVVAPEERVERVPEERRDLPPRY